MALQRHGWLYQDRQRVTTVTIPGHWQLVRSGDLSRPQQGV